MKLLRIIIAGLMIAAMNIFPASPLYSEAGAVESVHPVSDSTSLSALSLSKDSIKVAVLDSGCNTAYKEGISLIDSTPGDHNGHGTLMVRIIEEVYPGAELYIVKVIGDNGLAVNEKAVILGLEWAISRDVDIINISLRLKGSPELYQAIRKAYQKGIVIVAAAGNRRTNEAGVRYATDTVAYPARYDEVIAVGALDRSGKVYSGSIEGDEVTLRIRGYSGNRAGTSIASAYAAGLVAKIMSENQDKDIHEIKNILIRAAQGR